MTEAENKVRVSIEKARNEWKEKDTISFRLRQNQLYLSTICLEEYSRFDGIKGFYVFIPEKDKRIKVSFPFEGRNEKENGRMIRKLLLFKMLTDTYSTKIMLTRREIKNDMPIDEYIASKRPSLVQFFHFSRLR